MIVLIKENKVARGRTEVINGDTYTVYPVIMLTTGVHAGSGGSTLYTEEELQNFSQTWNGVPVTLQHPDRNGEPVSANSPDIYKTQVLGTVFNTAYSNGKLKAEVWLRNRDLDTLDPDLKGRLLSGERLEVSTGLFCEDEEASGTYNNESYNSIARNIRPDHLALLPGGTGACSWEDGCGIRENKEGGTMIRKKKSNSDEDIKQQEKFFVHSEDTLSLNEEDYTKIVDLIYSKIDSMDVRDEKMNYLVRVYSDYVIYKVRYADNSPTKMFKRNYNITDGIVEWISDPVQVTEEISYTEISNNSINNDTKINKGEKMDESIKTMKECCPDKVKELIDNNENFTEKDEEMLLSLSEDQFTMVVDKTKPVENTVDTETEEDNSVNNEEEKEVDTLDVLLQNAAPELRESIEYGQKILANKKDELITRIKTNKSNKFSDEELVGFGIDFLEKLESMSPKPKANYTANSGGSHFENNIEPLPVSNAWAKEEKKA